jgi:hypothetical protein
MKDSNRLTDLVGRLRSRVSVLDVDEAADAIEELMAALKPFTDAALEYDDYKDFVHINENDFITVSDLRSARAAYLGEEE